MSTAEKPQSPFNNRLRLKDLTSQISAAWDGGWVQNIALDCRTDVTRISTKEQSAITVREKRRREPAAQLAPYHS